MNNQSIAREIRVLIPDTLFGPILLQIIDFGEALGRPRQTG